MPLQSSLRRPAAISAVLLCGTSAVAVDAAATTRTAQKNDFMRAMESSSASRQVRAEKAAAANLRRKIAAAAVPRQPLQQQARRLDDANANDDGVWNAFGFDVADYSLKYAGCSAVATWSDDLAENNADDGNDGGNANGYYGGEWQSSTVVSMPKFVVFRLCPTDSCSDDRTFGCSNDYGEYIIDLTEYVQYLKEYKEEQLQRYCEYCEECVQAEGEWQQQQYDNGNYNYYDGNYNQDDDQGGQDEENNQDNQDQEEGEQEQNQEEGEENENQQDQQQNEGQEEGQEGEEEGEQQEGDDRRRRLEDAAGEEDNANDANDGEQQQDDANNGNNYQYGGCSDYDVCSTYGNACNDGNNDGGNNNNGNNYIDLTDYFYCQQVGGKYYVGPHCEADKTTISIGVYADEDCSIYIGDQVPFASIMPTSTYDYDFSELEVYYDSNCTSCRESDKPYQNVDGDEEDADDINELCQNLYQVAGKCNRYMYDAEDGSYQGYNQEANEEEVCGFIKNVVTGQYDENGYIYLDATQYEKDNRANRYAETGEVTAGQVWAILGLIALCSLLTIWACFLHRSLTRNTPWRPKLSQKVKQKLSKLSPRRSQSDRPGSYQPPERFA